MKSERIEMRISHTLGIGHFANVVLYKMRLFVDDERSAFLACLTARELRDLMRRALYTHGHSVGQEWIEEGWWVTGKSPAMTTTKARFDDVQKWSQNASAVIRGLWNQLAS